MMICEECKKNKQRSLSYPGGSTSTLLGFQPYFDEDGKYHNHDPNKITTYYNCSNGHKWVNSYVQSCWCGWPDKIETSNVGENI